MSIISNHEPEGPDFKIMGIWFDTGLSMRRGVTELCNSLRWKLTTLLRTRHLFDTPTLMIQFKSRILSYVEHRTAAIYHVDATILHLIDKQFDRFLSQLGLSRLEALTIFFLAPLNARRDMAMLGVIHRAVLGKGPKQISEFFKLDPKPSHPTGRSCLRRHDRQIMSFRRGKFLETTAK